MNPISKLEPGGKTEIYIASQFLLKPDENHRVQGLVFNVMVTMATMATML